MAICLVITSTNWPCNVTDNCNIISNGDFQSMPSGSINIDDPFPENTPGHETEDLQCWRKLWGTPQVKTVSTDKKIFLWSAFDNTCNPASPDDFDNRSGAVVTYANFNTSTPYIIRYDIQSVLFTGQSIPGNISFRVRGLNLAQYTAVLNSYSCQISDDIYNCEKYRVPDLALSGIPQIDFTTLPSQTTPVVSRLRYISNPNYNYLCFYPSTSEQNLSKTVYLDNVQVIPLTLPDITTSTCHATLGSQCSAFNDIFTTLPNNTITWTTQSGTPISGGTDPLHPIVTITASSADFLAHLSFYESNGTLQEIVLSQHVISTYNFFNVAVSSNIGTIFCVGENPNINLSTSISGGTAGPYTYLWTSNPSGFSSTNSNPTVNPSVNTTYTVTVTDANNCTETAHIVITFNPVPTANAGSDIAICSGQNATLTATGGTSYHWSTGQPNNPITVTPTSTTTYTVTVTNTYGCTATDNVVVTVNPLPPANAGNDQSICIGHSTILTATGGTSYYWSTGQPGNPITITPTSTTTYTVPVTNTYGCTATDNIIVNVNPLPTITFNVTPTNPIYPGQTQPCPNQFTTIDACAGCGITGYTYQWSTGQTGNPITAAPLVNTTYFVTVTSLSGCISYDHVNVTVFQPPVAGFTFDKYDNCEDHSVVFTNTSSNATSLHWYWGDGTFSPSGNVSTINYSYAYPGYYNVQLNASNICYADVSYSDIIQILPSAIEYNDNNPDGICCIELFTDDHYENYPQSFDVNINSTSTPWNGGTKYIKGTLTITQGTTFTITGTTVCFHPQAKVVIEKGAELILNGATFMSIPWCRHVMWHGIEVWGDANNSNSSAQGKLTMINHSVIQDAHNAVILGKTKLIPSGNGFVYNGHETTAGGGIIRASYSSFNKNAVNIRFWEYNYNNHSYIMHCTFDGNSSDGISIIDPYYNNQNINNHYSYPPIKLHNPFYAQSNTGPGGTTISDFGIYQYRTYLSLLTDNTFSNMLTGIQIFDSKSSINSCHFNNLKTGISVANTASPVNYGNIIQNGTFSNVLGKNIGITKGVNDVIKVNIIGDPLIDLNGTSAYGIYLFQSFGFSVKDNTIQRLNTGIFVCNSGFGGGVIDNASAGNIVSRCQLGVQTVFSNYNLKIRCNYFENPLIAEYTKSWAINQSLPQQVDYLPKFKLIIL